MYIDVMHANRNLKFIVVGVIVFALVVFVKITAFKTRSFVDVPLLLLITVISVLFFMWLDYLIKKDKDKGFL